MPPGFLSDLTITGGIAPAVTAFETRPGFARDVADHFAASRRKLLKKGELKIYKGYPHSMLTTHAEELNADILAFIRD